MLSLVTNVFVQVSPLFMNMFLIDLCVCYITQGFRKVDPDRWEFANEWFLRGQIHLLKNIGRKRQIHNNNNMNNKGKYSMNSNNNNMNDEDEDEMVMAMEIARLKKEQKVLEQELVVMNRRLEATERRPEQMMSLLCKVAEDPDILQRMMLEKFKKKQRRLITPSSSSNGVPAVKREQNSSSDGYYGMWNNDGFSMELEPMNEVNMYGSNNNGDGGDGVNYFRPGSLEPDVDPAPPYPFSLLGGGF